MESLVKLTPCVMFLLGHFIYQYVSENPNYNIAFDRFYWSLMGMLFIYYYPFKT